MEETKRLGKTEPSKEFGHHQRVRLAIALVSFLILLFVPASAISASVQGLVFLVGMVFLVAFFVPLVEDRLIQKAGWLLYRYRKNSETISRKARRLLVGVAVLLLLTHLIGWLWVKPSQTAKTITPLASGLAYGTDLASNCRVHYLTVDLEKVRPAVLTSPTLAYGKRTLTRMVQESPSTLAAVNGDFFDEGGPSGFLLSQGRQTGPKQNRSALAFNYDGRRAGIELYRFATTANVTANDRPFRIRWSYNMPYVPGDVGVYTAKRGLASGSGRGAIQARVMLDSSCQEGDLNLTGTIESVHKDPVANLRPQSGEVVLTARNEVGVPLNRGVAAWAQENLFVGARVKIHLAISPKPGDLAVSGAPQLLDHGYYIAQEEGNEGLLKINTARTAVGITRDGRFLYVVAVEGPPKWARDSPRLRIGQLKARQFKAFFAGVWDDGRHFARAAGLRFLSNILGLTHVSPGMDSQELADYLASRSVNDQSIVSAINLDGGSSTVMIVNGRPVTATMNRKEEQLATALGFRPR